MPYPDLTLYPESTLYPGIDFFSLPPTEIEADPQARSLTRKLAGIAFTQDQMSGSDYFTPVDDTWRYQDFLFPSNYKRGLGEEGRVPALAGFSVAMEVLDETTLDLEFVIEHYLVGTGWVSEATGAVLSASEAGNVVWVDFYLNEPLEVSEDAADDRWRFGFRGNAGKAWVSVPSPLANVSATDGADPLTIDGEEFSYAFRILSMTADEGVDFLGNSFRNVVVEQDAANVQTGAGADDDTFWLSKPNPSKFAVESLYFDVRPDAEEYAVIDSVILDPITPGVYFHIYYSDEGDPASSPETWDNKLWQRVPKTFRALKRERHVLPEPISTKYVKIEFSQLQAQHYRPGDFAQPVTYKKFPKWVLDYFLLRYATDDLSVAPRVGVVWDTLDLAYNYYLDDLRQEPDTPVSMDTSQRTVVESFFKQRDDVSDVVDTTTLNQIDLTLKPYLDNPTTRSTYDYLLGVVASGQALTNAADYPSETAVGFTDVRPLATPLRHTQLVFEKNYPVMFFYLTARHRYREVQAGFTHDRAYFVGVRQVAFTRERYTAAHDTPLYIEVANDQLNLEYNDFETEDNVWVVYD